MPAKINLIGKIFGKITVLEETTERKNKSVVWKCKCNCGNIQYFSTKELRSDGIIQCSSCGTNRVPVTRPKENIIGNIYGNLKVLELSEKMSGGKKLYKCECSCPQRTIVYVSSTDLKNGHTQSCGCQSRKYKAGDIINNRQVIDKDFERKIKGRCYYKVKCLLCGREYSTLSSGLDNTCSCGCQKSLGEFYIGKILKENNIEYIKEYRFPESLYRFDFALKNKEGQIVRLIEFDGEQHYEDNVKNVGWNTYQKYQITHEHDQKKNRIAQDFNIPLVRIPYWERENITLDLILGDKYLIEKKEK